jgi:dipeptidyl aminopeptidase/acylaminoacyl peptidase
VLLFHGDEDVNVRIGHSEKMVRALKKAKKQVELVEYEEVEHSIRRNRYRIDMLGRIGEFLDLHTRVQTTGK